MFWVQPQEEAGWKAGDEFERDGVSELCIQALPLVGVFDGYGEVFASHIVDFDGDLWMRDGLPVPSSRPMIGAHIHGPVIVEPGEDSVIGNAILSCGRDGQDVSRLGLYQANRHLKREDEERVTDEDSDQNLCRFAHD